MNPLFMRIATLTTGKALFFGLLAALIYWMMFYDDGESYRRQIGTASSELEVEREKEKETDRAAARKNQLRSSYEALSEQFKIVSSQIPVDMDAPEVIRTVDSMAKTSGITIKSKEPRASQRQDILETYPIRVVAEGTFSEMTMFFYNLSTIDRIYRIRSFSFQAPSEERRRIGRLTMDVELASFKFVGEEKPPNAEGGER